MESVAGWHTHTQAHTRAHISGHLHLNSVVHYSANYTFRLSSGICHRHSTKKKTATTTVRLALNLLILPELRLILCVVAGLTVALITIKYYLLTMPGREHNVTPLAFALASE